MESLPFITSDIIDSITALYYCFRSTSYRTSGKINPSFNCNTVKYNYSSEQLQWSQVHVFNSQRYVYICLIKRAMHNNILICMDTVILLLLFHVSWICDDVLYVASIRHQKESTQDKGGHHKTDSTPAGEKRLSFNITFW